MPETTPSSAVTQIQQIPVDQIHSSRYQARKDFNEEDDKRLADSISKEGLIQPITVRKVGDGYEAIAGERRLRAVISLGQKTIEARVIEVASEAAACAKGLVENLQRKDLNPIEEAEGFQELNRLDPGHWTHDEIGKVSGKDRTYITRSLGLLSLSPEIQNYVRRRTLSRSHALEIMRLAPDQQEAAAEKVAKGDLSREETRKLVDQILGPVKQAAEKQGEKKEGRAKSASSLQFKLEGDFLQVTGSLPFQPVAGAVLAAADRFRDQLSAWMGSTGRGEEDTDLLAARKGPAVLCAKICGAEDSRTKMLEGKTWADFGIATPEEGLKAFMEGKITERR